MKKLLLSVSILLTLLSCSQPEQQAEQQTQPSTCKCYKVYYYYEPFYQGGTWVWKYIETGKELFSSGGGCQETDYLPNPNNNGNTPYYRIECRPE